FPAEEPMKTQLGLPSARAKVLPVASAIGPPPLRYTVAVVMPVIAAGFTILLRARLEPSPLALFYLTVVLVGWYGGFGPSLLAAAISFLSAAFFVFPPMASLAATDGAVSGLIVFGVTALASGGIAGSLHGAHQRAEAERLRNAELVGRLEEAQRLAHFGSWEWDVAANRVTWSDELYRLYGLQPQEFGATFEAYLERVHPDDRERARSVVQAALHTGGQFAFEERIVRPDGSERVLESRGKAFLDGAGQPIRLVGVCRDITLEKAAEQRTVELAMVEAARGEAETANRTKADFMAMMSHDLRTPLNAIAGYAEVLEMEVHGPLNPRQHESVERIAINQRRVLSFVSDLLNFCRIEAGEMTFEFSDVPLGKALAELEPTIAPQIQQKHLRYVYQPCDPRLTVRADREKMEQVILNLMTNAIKYTDDCGQIALQADASGDDQVAIRVRDTGRGIPPEKLATVFEPFIQVGDQPRRDLGGVGLGLAISRRLARAMGGDVIAESVESLGSTFTLVLPRGQV
ncbi:MAG TPA: ATP-binding protein, partial [Longimicrobiales bacterium]|nr:ATP-binding protein [Longimicrobiales bacterium]